MFMIGIDPHKGSHTAAAVDRDEAVIDTIRVDADVINAARLLAWAARFEPRTWAVEGATGMGALLAQQLVAAGEHVVDVPPKLSSRVRLLERGRIDKTDPNDARSAAIVAWHNPTLNIVAGLDEHRVVLRLLADRDHQITANRTRTICRLHAMLCLLIEGGTGTSSDCHQSRRTVGHDQHRRPDHRWNGSAAARQLLDEIRRARRRPRRGPRPHQRDRRRVRHDGHRDPRDRPVDGGDHHRPRRRRAPLPDRRTLRPPQRHRTNRSLIRTQASGTG